MAHVEILYEGNLTEIVQNHGYKIMAYYKIRLKYSKCIPWLDGS